jgi:hypothetical protein
MVKPIAVPVREQELIPACAYMAARGILVKSVQQSAPIQQWYVIHVEGPDLGRDVMGEGSDYDLPSREFCKALFVAIGEPPLFDAVLLEAWAELADAARCRGMTYGRLHID